VGGKKSEDVIKKSVFVLTNWLPVIIPFHRVRMTGNAARKCQGFFVPVSTDGNLMKYTA